MQNELRETFDTQANLYNKMRPGYPDQVFEALIQTTGITNSSELLEIGPGTGQATKLLAMRGYNILAVELGNDLAKVAQHELAEYKNVKVVCNAFEDINLEPKSFDLIYSSTAFHWIKPEIKFIKTHSLLKKDGYLAVIHRNHLTGDDFFEAMNPIYDKYSEKRPNKENTDHKRTKSINDISSIGIIDEKYFDTVFHKVFPDSKEYTADEYIQLMSTYSSTIAMPERARADFLNDTHALIMNNFGGSVTRNYGISLTIGKKVN